MSTVKQLLLHVRQKYRYSVILLRQLVITDFKLRYQGSFLGYVWSLLRPLALFVILYFVFVKFLKFGADVPHFPVYLLLGVVIWNYFAEVTTGGVASIVAQGNLIRKLNFPKYVIVLAGSFSALINLGINLLVVFGFMVFNGVDFRNEALLAPLLIAELFVFALALAFWLSALFVRLRDVNYIWEVIMQAAFYATPILYPITMIPEKVAKVLLLSPMAQIIQDLRYLLVTDHTVTLGSAYANEWMRIIPVGVVMIMAVSAAMYFKKRSKYFAEEV